MTRHESASSDEVIPDELPPDGASESTSVAMRRKKPRPVENGEIE